MMKHAVSPSEIWPQSSEIWPDFAKSGILAKSGIWLFPFGFRGLEGPFQISEGSFRNLLRNLDLPNTISVLRQISDFGKVPPKGVGVLPATGGESHHLPLGNFSGRNLGPGNDPTTAARTAKHMTAVVFHPRSQPEKETTMAEATLTTRMREAIPDLPPAFRADRTLLALDLGTTTGWALHGADGLITSGTVSFRPGRFDGGGMRYLRFSNWLTEIDRLSGPVETIWFEEVRRHVGTDAAHVFGGLLATLTAWAELSGIPYGGVPVGTIKKFATGKGNANKVAMMTAVRARGFSPADDNEADAIAILLWAIETNGGLA